MINPLNPINMVDFYKLSHISQYPSDTEILYSNFTARSDKHYNKTKYYNGKIVFWGLQAFIKDIIIEKFNTHFFNRPKKEVISEYKEVIENMLGKEINTSNIEKLHDIGYLPLEIKALKEGSEVNIKVPVITIKNTDKRFFWVTNYIETMLSAEMWKPITAATIARDYKNLVTYWSDKTCDNDNHVLYQCHDFGFRGMGSIEDAGNTSSGHLLYFLGSDTVPANIRLRNYYTSSKENYIYSSAIRGTEHSVMCAGGKEYELETFKRLLTNKELDGNFSIVSDTWDLGNVLTNILPKCKDIILNRNGTTVIRPDSGDPVKIVCGDKSLDKSNPLYYGCLELLWKEFGGTFNSKGYRVLNPKIGLVYGDGITINIADKMLDAMEKLGFASSNIVLGVGSYTYQYLTRDTLGFAVKATYGVFGGTPRELFKDPITDDGTKKSAKGLLKVIKENNNYILLDQQTESEERTGELKTVFINGKLTFNETIDKLRNF